MEHEAAADIAEDCLLDASKDCQDCANSRLIDRQRKEIERINRDLYEIREERFALRLQVEALKEEIAGIIRGTH